MKLKKTADMVAFLRATRSCAGQVWFCTPEGDRLNLCSQLSQCLFSLVAGNRALMDMGVLELSDPGDAAVLSEFLEA